MSKKTAMQELINYMQENFHLTEDSMEVFKKSIEKEKEQIVDAFTDGQLNIANVFIEEYKKRGLGDELEVVENDKEDGENYYNETYNHD